ncbi:ATP-binding protein [Streptomyces sp. NPDC051109]|uniref:ATP-binding protein n=1 Tax=Streptomyces sp. NPDC051109 TaxID=3365642 RepID=UPI0037A1E948
MEERTLSSRLLPDPAGPGVSCIQARDTARALLARLHVPSAGVDDVVTVVSELVSNAERHAGGATLFEIHARSGVVTVEVSDRTTRLPEAQTWAPGRPGGFGWRLIHVIAATIHVRAHQGGKTVVATFTDKQLHAANP